MQSQQKPTVIGERLRIAGEVVAEGLTVELNGRIDGDVSCGVLIVAAAGCVAGKVTARKVVVRGLVEGPIYAGELVLEAEGRVNGDIHCDTVAIDKGAFLEGRIAHGATVNGEVPAADLPLERQRRRRNGTQ